MPEHTKNEIFFRDADIYINSNEDDNILYVDSSLDNSIRIGSTGTSDHTQLENLQTDGHHIGEPMPKKKVDYRQHVCDVCRPKNIMGRRPRKPDSDCPECSGTGVVIVYLLDYKKVILPLIMEQRQLNGKRGMIL